MIGNVFRDLRANRLRTALTALSMLVGVLLIVLISTASTVVADAFVAQAEQVSGKTATFEAAVGGENVSVRQMTLLQEQIDSRTTGGSVAAMVTSSQTLKFGHPGQIPSIKVVSTFHAADFGPIYRWPVTEGETVNTGNLNPSITLNAVAAAQLGTGTGDVIQGMNSVNDAKQQFVVRAVVANGQSEPQAYIPLGSSALWPSDFFGGASPVIKIHASPASLPAITALVADSLHFSDWKSEVNVQRVDTVDQLESSIALLSAVFLTVAMVALAVSAVGMLNIGLASMAERSRELVIRRALGARRINVFTQVLLGSLAIGLIVAIASIVLAAVGVYVVLPTILPDDSPIQAPEFPWTASALGLSVALATALVGGLFPAVKASRLPVADALRS